MKNKNNLSDLVDVLLELTGIAWQVGAVISVILGLCTVRVLFWVIQFNSTNELETGATHALSHIGWIFYAVPLILSAFTVIFAKVSISSYKNTNL